MSGSTEKLQATPEAESQALPAPSGQEAVAKMDRDASPKKSKTPKKKEKKSKVVPFVAPAHLFVDFQEGVDKAVLESVKERIFAYARDNLTSRSQVTFNIKKVVDHSYFEDGYLFEIIEGGSGHTVLPQLLKQFEQKDVRLVGFETQKGGFVTMEKAQGNVSTYLYRTIPADIPAEDVSPTAPINKKLYVTSYLGFYLSQLLLICGVFSVILAMSFKYVLFQEEKMYLDENHYSAANGMPIKQMIEAQSTETERMTSIQYSKREKWFIRKEINDEFGQSFVKEKINSRGGVTRIAVDHEGNPIPLSGKKSQPKNKGVE